MSWAARKQAMKEYQAGILASMFRTHHSPGQNLKKLADLKPKTLAIMHGSKLHTVTAPKHSVT